MHANGTQPVSKCGSLIDRIGVALQQRAALDAVPMTIQTSPAPSPAQTVSPAIPSPRTGKRCHSPTREQSCKKTLPPLVIKEEEDLSDTDSSNEGTHEDNASSECISPLLSSMSMGSMGLDEVFCSVPGRLSLLSSTSKYKVTLGEIQRRLGHPENLNASILGGILRRAKSKNGGKELRETLEKLGLNLPAGRRKSATVTLLTSMVEGEAVHLAKDFTFLCEKEFPAKTLAEHKSNLHKLDVENLQKRKDDLQSALKVIDELVALMNGTSPDLNESVQRPIDNFNLYTHNFGTTALLASYSTVRRYIDMQLQILGEKQTSRTAAIDPSALASSILYSNLLPSNLTTLAHLMQLTNQKKRIHNV